jgi:hypothetical protein
MEDILIKSFAELKKVQWYKGPDFGDLDDRGKKFVFFSGDLAARLCLNGEAIWQYECGNHEGACTLFHAERYLADRAGYEREPWPKGMIKI